MAPRATRSDATWSWQMRLMTASDASHATSTRAPRSEPGAHCGSTHCASSCVDAQPASHAAAPMNAHEARVGVMATSPFASRQDRPRGAQGSAVPGKKGELLHAGGGPADARCGVRATASGQRPGHRHAPAFGVRHERGHHFRMERDTRPLLRLAQRQRAFAGQAHRRAAGLHRRRAARVGEPAGGSLEARPPVSASTSKPSAKPL